MNGFSFGTEEYENSSLLYYTVPPGGHARRIEMIEIIYLCIYREKETVR